MVVSLKEIAKKLKLTEKRIQQLAKINVVKKVKHGKYELEQSINNYEKYKEKAKLKINSNKNTFTQELQKQKIKQIKAQTKKIKIETKKMNNELVNFLDAKEYFERNLTKLKNKMLELPASLEFKIENLEKCEVKDLIEQEIISIFNDIENFLDAE